MGKVDGYSSYEVKGLEVDEQSLVRTMQIYIFQDYKSMYVMEWMKRAGPLCP